MLAALQANQGTAIKAVMKKSLAQFSSSVLLYRGDWTREFCFAKIVHL
jgi:hypothetical protein